MRIKGSNRGHTMRGNAHFISHIFPKIAGVPEQIKQHTTALFFQSQIWVLQHYYIECYDIHATSMMTSHCLKLFAKFHF